jgi:hypothetical protein
MTYQERLKINHDGDSTKRFYTKSGLLVATGYERVVFGGRGPYIEFKPKSMVKENCYMPEDVKWKKHNDHKYKVYYYEARTVKDDVKIYYQTQTVDYADYKVGLMYVSPFELYDESGTVLIETLRKKK